MSELGKSFPTNVDKLKSEIGGNRGIDQSSILDIYYMVLSDRSIVYPEIQGQILRSETPGVFVLYNVMGDSTYFAPEPVKRLTFTGGGIWNMVYCVLAPDFEGFYLDDTLVTEYVRSNMNDAETPEDLQPGSSILYRVENQRDTCVVSTYDPKLIIKHEEE